jgi:hypothetical protein
MRALLVFFATLTLSAAAGLLLSFPMAGAIVCPTCFGFVPIGDDIFVESTMSETARRDAAATLPKSRERVRAFYGVLLREPRVFICATEDCYRRYAGGGSRGTAFLDRALILAPDPATVPIAAHELSHIELHARIGLFATVRDALPRWFDEGLAVNVSDDPRYLLPGTGRARCRMRADDALPASRSDWLEAADGRLYAISACRVAEWLAARNGSAGVRTLAERIARGDSFQDAFEGALR